MLSIKPLLDLSSGEVVAAGKQRTRKKSLAWLREQISNADEVENFAILHSNATDIDEFLASLPNTSAVNDARTDIIGAVIGTHGGPGIIGITYQIKG